METLPSLALASPPVFNDEKAVVMEVALDVMVEFSVVFVLSKNAPTFSKPLFALSMLALAFS